MRQLPAGDQECRSPQFVIVRVRNMLVDTAAVQRQHGMELMVGNAAIAQVMGVDADLAVEMGSTEVWLCQECAAERQLSAFQLMEMEPALVDKVTGQ